MGYETYIQAGLPRWLRGIVADSLTTVLGGALDTVVSGVKEAANQAYAEYAADDAVPGLLAERLLEPITGETLSAQRLRVLGAWDFWSDLSSTTSLQSVMRLYTGLAGLWVYPFNGDNSSPAWVDGYDPLLLDDDNEIDNWSRHTVVIEQPHPWIRQLVGSVVVSAETIVGISMLANELTPIRRAYRRHRPAHMVGILIHVLLEEDTAEQYRQDHGVTTEVVLLPLHARIVRYTHTGVEVGPSCILGGLHE